MCKSHRRVEQRPHADVARVAGDARPARPRGTERVGDRDRETTARTLQAAAAEGLIGLDELEERLTEAWSARTGEQLASVAADLPPSWIDDRARAAGRDAVARGRRAALRHQALAFAVVMLVMVSVWLATGAGYVWPIWPALGWGPWLLREWQATRARSGRARTAARLARVAPDLDGGSR